MSDRRITFEMLNAYVDGELDTAAAAEVAKAIAEDSTMAREVAALSRLRSAVSESIEAPPLSLPKQRSTGGRTLAIAASIGFALAVAGSVLLSGLGRDSGSEWQARAWQIHRAWSMDGVTAQVRSTILLAHHTETVPGAYVPDLSASRLSLVHVAVAPFGGEQRALLAGYRGSRGCKISLLVFPSRDVLDVRLKHFRNAKNEAFAWETGPIGYMILSDGMDSDRFRLLAESVRHSSLQHRPFDKKTRTALRQSREKSAPCLA
jgi:anti-sigma factor RsiW